MKIDLKLLHVSSALLLVMLFLAYTSYGSNLGLAGKNFSIGNQVTVEFEVLVKSDDGTINPAKDAMVVVGLENNKTDEHGKTSIVITPGSYSSYVKLSDIKLAPYTDKLTIKGDSKITVVFWLTKLSPTKFSIMSIENKTIVRLSVFINDGYKAYLSDPVLTLVRNNGSISIASVGPNGNGYFINRIIPGKPSEISVMLNGTFSYIDPYSSYIPAEIINVVKT